MAQVSFASLSAKLVDQVVVITAVKDGVGRLKARLAAAEATNATLTATNVVQQAQITDLQAQIAANNPAEVQAQIDTESAAVDTNNTELVTIAEGIPPDPPPPAL